MSRDAARSIRDRCTATLAKERDAHKMELLRVVAEGFSVVADCRSSIAYSCVRMHGMKEGDASSEIFRFALSTLEDATDKQQEELEGIAKSHSTDKLSALLLSIRALKRLNDSFLLSHSVKSTASAEVDDEDEDGEDDVMITFRTPFPVPKAVVDKLIGARLWSCFIHWFSL